MYLAGKREHANFIVMNKISRGEGTGKKEEEKLLSSV